MQQQYGSETSRTPTYARATSRQPRGGHQPNASASFDEAMAGIRGADASNSEGQPQRRSNQNYRQNDRGQEAQDLEPRGNDQPRMTQSASEQPSVAGQQTARDGSRNVHVYGGKAALTFEPDTRRNGGHTLSLDAAAMRGDHADWKNKIRFQFTQDELPVLCAVLLGLHQEAEFNCHGPDKKKATTVFRRDNAILFLVTNGGPTLTVPVPPGQVYAIGALALEQMRMNNPRADGTMILTMIKSILPMVPPVRARK